VAGLAATTEWASDGIAFLNAKTNELTSMADVQATTEILHDW